jgi:hypothetical protein
MNNKDTQLEVLSTHYSETFSLLKSAVEKRDRLFLYVLLTIFALLLYIGAPSGVSDWLNSFVSNQAGSNNTGNSATLIEASFIGAILLLGLLSLSHTYFQTVLHVERQFDYVYQLEGLLSISFDNKAFIREGIHYQTHKRKFASWTKFIFWYLFPFLFLIFNIVWLLFLFTKSQASTAFKIVDSLIIASMLTSMVLYLLALITKK